MPRGQVLPTVGRATFGATVGILVLPLLDAASHLQRLDLQAGVGLTAGTTAIDPGSASIVWATATLLGVVAWSARHSPAAPLAAAIGVSLAWLIVVAAPDSLRDLGTAHADHLWPDAFAYVGISGYFLGPLIAGALAGSALFSVLHTRATSRAASSIAVVLALAATTVAVLAVDFGFTRREDEFSHGSSWAAMTVVLAWAAGLLMVAVVASATVTPWAPTVAASALLAGWVVSVVRGADLLFHAITEPGPWYPGLGAYSLTYGYLGFPLLVGVLLGTAVASFRRG